MHDTGDAVVVLQGGEPAAVLMAATEFAALCDHRRFLAAIGEGLADVDAGHVLTTQELNKSIEAEPSARERARLTRAWLMPRATSSGFNMTSFTAA